VDPGRLGSLEPWLQARVNGEVYRFASRHTLHLFRLHPVRYCGLLRDPVSGRRFYPTIRSPRCDWDGSPYFFAGASTRATFLKAPTKYEVKRTI
jgi:YHS domain-containing protein